MAEYPGLWVKQKYRSTLPQDWCTGASAIFIVVVWCQSKEPNASIWSQIFQDRSLLKSQFIEHLGHRRMEVCCYSLREDKLLTSSATTTLGLQPLMTACLCFWICSCPISKLILFVYDRWANSSVIFVYSMLILVLVEYCWNVYPSTTSSSLLLLSSHLVLLCGLFFAKRRHSTAAIS